MLFVYECTGNIIADFKKFYDTQLSEQDKKKIFIPTYDCMKRYQGSWHVEQKPLFTDCFFIECRNKEELKTTLSRQHCSDSLAEAVMSGITPLRPEQEENKRSITITPRAMVMLIFLCPTTWGCSDICLSDGCRLTDQTADRDTVTGFVTQHKEVFSLRSMTRIR